MSGSSTRPPERGAVADGRLAKEVAVYVERAAWLELRAWACIRQARDGCTAKRLPLRRRRELVARAQTHVATASRLVRAAQQTVRNPGHGAVLDEHRARLQVLTERIERESAQYPAGKPTAERADGRRAVQEMDRQ
jgi:hypothetical protein